ncbi:uncharacterized protein LOC129572103 [Sitodiplosis mosellana]|uniref:uncharacterized protein LOC129572103 n=1 Tax=Sitodiplosis mosellana TaxID=263140 RepID=UPI00244402BA|nr:uncharacterized protein LOC129572103 [Sitodiplosis mosellana]
MSPEFDNVFINLGSFHIELSFFKAIGKLIDSSGITKIMVESGILAEGSVKGLLGGTHFNRCKKLHVVAALSFKVLHFKAFMDEYSRGDGESILHENEIIEILERDIRNPGESDASPNVLDDLMNRYNSYTEDTLAGKHGKTAQFVSLYVWFIELYQMFERAIRSSDLNMYIYAAYRICPLFFTFNHQNYARWLTRNLNDLMNVGKTHPGLWEEFENGALSIRRTSKQFCRTPIDLTLEQTINADAANKLTGITAFTNSLCARKRWSETHATRTAVITHLLESLDLVKSNEGSDQYNSKIFNQQRQKFSKEVYKNINPFDEDINPLKLFNLASGQAATSEVAEFLINAETSGLKQMETFMNECRETGMRFERPIKRNVIRNFASESIKSMNSTHKRVDEAKIERNILGKILCLALDNEINLRSILSYPLATVPHALAHFEGSIASGKQKEELTSLLTANIDRQTDTPDKIDVDMIDGFNLLSNIKDAPVKYGQLAKYVIRILCNTTAHEVHVFFHKHVSPSPRDMNMRKQKELYKNASTNFQIRGPNQERTCSLAKCLSSESFKEELVKFFIEYWSSPDFDEPVPDQKRVFLSFGEKCFLFGNSFSGKDLSTFNNNHFEIESKIILHLHKIRATNICIKTANADTLLVYLLYHMQFWDNSREIWIQTNNVQTINVRSIYRAYSGIFVKALPAWFMYTGCIYEPSFYGKGRKTCWNILQKHPQFQRTFANVGNGDNLRETDLDSLAEFTCQLYGTNSKDVDEARFILFQKGFGSKNNFNFTEKGVDFKNLPPCKSVIRKKIERTNYMAQMVKQSEQNYLEIPSDGWFINEMNELELDYYSGSPFPTSITNMTSDEDLNEENDDHVVYNSSDDEEEYEDDDNDWNP